MLTSRVTMLRLLCESKLFFYMKIICFCYRINKDVNNGWI